MAIGSSRFDAGTWAREPRFACWPEAGEQDRPRVPRLVTRAAQTHPAPVVAWFVHSQRRQVSANT